MKHESNKQKELVYSKTNDNFDSWINKDYIPMTLKETLKKADVLIVPMENFDNRGVVAFPTNTDVILNYLKENLKDKFITDICIDDDDYKECAMHSKLQIIGSFVLKSIVLGIFLNILSTYIYNKIFKMDSDAVVKISITVVNESGESKNIQYEGKAEYFGETIEQIEKYNED